MLGLPILGDDLYGGPEAPTHRDLQPKKQRARLHLPVFQGVAIHLAEVQLVADDVESVIACEVPKHLRLLYRRMGLAEEA